MNCTFCGQPLVGKLDTFGEVGEEMCRKCWCDPALQEDRYGAWKAIYMTCSFCYKRHQLMTNPEQSVSWTCPHCQTHHYKDWQHIGSDPDAWENVV